jgi:DNA (cytosine-5)-methyltransferase 1
MRSNVKFMQFAKVGENRGTPRYYFEGDRLESLSFTVGSRFSVRKDGASRLSLVSCPDGDRVVSYRRTAGGVHPVIDIENASLLSSFASFGTVKVSGFMGRLDIAPSIRAFHAARSRQIEPPFHVTEFFCGGGGLSSAFSWDSRFVVTAGVEIESDFLNVWQKMHPGAVPILADIRDIHPSELPTRCDIITAGIPCTSHSSHGRAKKHLAGTPELGDTGDLFLSVLAAVAARMPAACVFENVPSFGDSLAGKLIVSHLAKLGYHVTQSVLEPHSQWGQVSDRRRWCMVATLAPGFQVVAPGTAFSGTAGDFLDPVDPVRDSLDADRIAVTVAGLDRHNARHAAQGHGFGYSVVDHQSTKIPTLTGSMHKINNGPFVRCVDGRVRMMRKAELERIHGTHVPTDHFATACRIIGQGVQEPVWANIATQLANHLTGGTPPLPARVPAPGQMALFEALT